MQLNLGNIVIVAALVSSLGLTSSLFWGYWKNRTAPYVRTLAGASGVLLFGAYGYLTYLFVVTDYSNGYVWNHASDALSFLYKLTAPYTGIEGSLLLWATLLAITVIWLVRKGARTQETKLVGGIAAFVLSYFIGMALLKTPFYPVEIAPREGIMMGPMGLNPLLKNPYMAIHPPVTFAGYASVVIPFAIGVAHFYRKFRTGEGLFRDWVQRVTGWLRLSWFFLLASVALGALWSYSTLGWGGLWAWDPVETAILFSFLFVTAAVHALANYRARGETPLLAPAMATAAFPSVVFTRMVTQSGDAFGGAAAVHTFGQSISKPLLVMLVGSLAAGIGLPAAYWLLKSDPESRETSSGLSHGNMLFLSVIVLALLAAVTFWGLVLPALLGVTVGTTVDIGVNYFNLLSYPPAIAVVLLLGFYNDYALRDRAALKPLAVVVVATVLAAFVPMWAMSPGSSGIYSFIGQLSMLSFVPPTVYAAVTILYRIARQLPGLSDRSTQMQHVGRTAIHLAFVIVLVAAPATYVFSSSSVAIASDRPTPVQNSSYTAQVTDFSESRISGATRFTPKEQRAIASDLERYIWDPAQISSQQNRTVLVRGEITDIRQMTSMYVAQLDGVNFWVILPTSNLPNPDQFIGESMYVQGQYLGSFGGLHSGTGAQTGNPHSGDTTSNTTSSEASSNVSTSSENGTAATDATNSPHTTDTNSTSLTDTNMKLFQPFSKMPYGTMLARDPLSSITPRYRALSPSATVRVTDGGSVVASGEASYDEYVGFGKVYDPLIKRGLTADTYIVLQDVGQQQSGIITRLQIKRVPAMNVVRLSVVLFLIGGALYVISDRGLRLAGDDTENGGPE